MDDVIAVVTDLMSQSRITAVSRRTGRNVRFIRTIEEARTFDLPKLVLVDLDASVDVSSLIRFFKRDPTRLVVAYGPHLDAEKLKSARAAGADRVLARSRFTADLPGILSSSGNKSEDVTTT